MSTASRRARKKLKPSHAGCNTSRPLAYDGHRRMLEAARNIVSTMHQTQSRGLRHTYICAKQKERPVVEWIKVRRQYFGCRE